MTPRRLRRAARPLLAAIALATALAAPARADAQDAAVASAGPAKIDTGEITKLERVPIPLAVMDILAPVATKDTSEVADAGSGILRRDLEICGEFDIILAKSALHDWRKEGLAPSGISFKDWMNVGAQALIKGEAKAAGERYTLDLRLYDVGTGRQIRLDWTPQEVDKAGVRGAVHAFANEVYRHYIGKPGFFGSRIAYVHKLANGNKAVFLMDHDGDRRARLSTTDTLNLLPAWSPNGGALVYTSYANGQPDLFLHRTGSKGAVAISSHPGMNVGGAFSPDGSTIALTLSKDGNSEIYTIDATTGAIKSRLTSNWAIDSSPTWSPDGRRMAFVSDRSGSPQIYVMGADGGDAKRLTFQGSYNTTPEWSPRGDVIAFTARDEHYRFDIFTVHVDTGEIVRLTQNQGNNEEPSWSPDGRYLVFTSTRKGGQKVYVMTYDGLVQTCITENGSGYATPAWGPAP